MKGLPPDPLLLKAASGGQKLSPRQKIIFSSAPRRTASFLNTFLQKPHTFATTFG